MIRKLLVVAAAIAMPVSVVAVSGGLAGASNPHTAGTDTIKCTKLTGTVKFSPKLTIAGYKSGATTTTVSAKLSGCTAAGSFKTKVSGGTVTGTIKGVAGTASSPSGKCAALTGSNTAPVRSPPSGRRHRRTPPRCWVSRASLVAPIRSHGTFTIPGKTKGTASGSFLGTNRVPRTRRSLRPPPSPRS